MYSCKSLKTPNKLRTNVSHRIRDTDIHPVYPHPRAGGAGPWGGNGSKGLWHGSAEATCARRPRTPAVFHARAVLSQEALHRTLPHTNRPTTVPVWPAHRPTHCPWRVHIRSVLSSAAKRAGGRRGPRRTPCRMGHGALGVGLSPRSSATAGRRLGQGLKGPGRMCAPWHRSSRTVFCWRGIESADITCCIASCERLQTSEGAFGGPSPQGLMRGGGGGVWDTGSPRLLEMHWTAGPKSAGEHVFQTWNGERGCRVGGRDALEGGTPPPPPGSPAYAQPMSPSRQVPASMAFLTDSNHPQTLWQPPPTACLTASGAALGGRGGLGGRQAPVSGGGAHMNKELRWWALCLGSLSRAVLVNQTQVRLPQPSTAPQHNRPLNRRTATAARAAGRGLEQIDGTAALSHAPTGEGAQHPGDVRTPVASLTRDPQNHAHAGGGRPCAEAGSAVSFVSAGTPPTISESLGIASRRRAGYAAT